MKFKMLSDISKLDIKTKGPILDGLASAYDITEDIEEKIHIKDVWYLILRGG